jgi:hypothetical protein
MNRRTLGFVLLGLVVIAGLIGAGAMFYHAGVAEGLARSGQVGAAGALPGPLYGPHFGYGRFGGSGFPGWGVGFAFFGLVRFLLFAGLIVFLLRWLVWGGRGRRWLGGEDGNRQGFDEWHRRAHQAQSGSDTE